MSAQCALSTETNKQEPGCVSFPENKLRMLDTESSTEELMFVLSRKTLEFLNV